MPFPKIHDLVALLNAGGELLKDLDPLRAQLANLSTFSVAARYPGEDADQQAAQDAMKTGEKVRSAVRARLGLS